MIERLALEEKIGMLRDEPSRRATEFARVARLLVIRPESVFPEARNIDPQFSGESAVDVESVEVDSLTEELRATIALKKRCPIGSPKWDSTPTNLNTRKICARVALCPIRRSLAAGGNENPAPKQVGFGAKRPRART
jgi:hypothetical protein